MSQEITNRNWPEAPFVFRPARDEDLPRIIRLFAGAVKRMRKNGIDQWDELYPDAGTLSADVAKREMYILEANGAVAAAVVLNGDQPPEYAGVPWKCGLKPVAVVHRLCVGAEHQGRGLSSIVLRASEDRLKSQGYRCVRLDAFPQNPPAMRLYPSAGYRLAGRVTFRKGIFYCYEKQL